MALTLERIIDKIEQQWPYYVGIGVVAWVGYKAYQSFTQPKENKESGSRIGKVEGG